MIHKANLRTDNNPRMASLPNSQAHHGALPPQPLYLQAGISSGTKTANAGTTLKRPLDGLSGIRQSPPLGIYHLGTMPLAGTVDMAVAMEVAITSLRQVLCREDSMVSSSIPSRRRKKTKAMVAWLPVQREVWPLERLVGL